MAHFQLLCGAVGRLLCFAELCLRSCLHTPGLLSLCRDQPLCQSTDPHALWSSLRALAALLGCLAECLHLQLLPGDITET